MKNGLLFAIVLGVLVSCTSNQTAEVRLSGPTMGSSYNITYLDREARNFGPQIDSLLLVFNEVFSTYDSSSVISYFNQSDTGIALIGESLQWFRELMQATDSVYQASSGAFNPALGPLISFWGFTIKHSPFKYYLILPSWIHC
jgi:FAD:protein FMN transferase